MVPDNIAQFLKSATPDAWLQAALKQLSVLLNDHANCELKAASTALSLIYRYPEISPLCARMSRLAREELRHFEQVRKLMEGQGVAFEKLSASRYARGLHDACDMQEPKRLLDGLLVGALIEARSCERFAVLVPHLESPLQAFYRGLLASEARHFENYLALARQVTDATDTHIAARLEELLEVEAELVLKPDTEFRFHSGPPGPLA